jgi:hypothetical protein
VRHRFLSYPAVFGPQPTISESRAVVNLPYLPFGGQNTIGTKWLNPAGWPAGINRAEVMIEDGVQKESATLKALDQFPAVNP